MAAAPFAASAAAAAAAAAAADPSNPNLNLRARYFPHWRKAVAGVTSGKASSKVLFVGTSITLGAGVGFEFPTQSVPAYFAQFANASIASATQSLGAITPVTPNDSRFSVGSGWSAEGGGPGLGWANVGYIAGNPGAGRLTFTPAPSQAIDTFDVWYIGNQRSGSMVASVSGPPTTKIITALGGKGGIAKATIRCPAGTSNVLSLHSVSGSGVFVFAIDAYLSTHAALHVGNAGVSGLGTSLHWATASAGSSLACIRAYRPSLTVIALGGDDAIIATPPTPLTAFTKAVRQVITTAQRSGDVLLWTEPLSESGGLASVRSELAFANALRSLASAHHVGLVDVRALFVSGASAAAHHLFYDKYHPNQQGNIAIAQALVQALGSVL